MKRTTTPALALIAWLLLPQTGHAFYNPNTGRWLSRDPIGEQGGNDLYAFCANRPIDYVDGSGLIGCSARRTCYCCCVDNLQTDPNPPKVKYTPFKPSSILHPFAIDGVYNVPFNLVIDLSYKHALAAKDRDCKLKWLETWYAPSAPPWYAPDVKYDQPYDVTDKMASDFPPASSCGASPIVRIPDKPGSRSVKQTSSWIMNLKIEVLVTSGTDPICKDICKYQQKKLTLTIKLKMSGGKPDRTYESILPVTE